MVLELVSAGFFRICHGSQLVYNTCWEDPRLDRAALAIGPSDRVLVITSAGCNALDYLLDAPAHVYAVDLNRRQNALLQLKLAGIRALDHATFFELFGRGHLDAWNDVYQSCLRQHLSGSARVFWDRHGRLMRSRGRRGSFYFRGSAGFFAWLVNVYIDRIARIRDDVDTILGADSLDEQRAIYESRIKPKIWGPVIRWSTRRDITLALLGVPRSQRRQIDTQYPGGVAQYIEDQVDELFMQVPLQDNYFWRVYMTGQYTPDCCPEYLKADNFQRLKNGLVDRITVHTDSILGLLREGEEAVSRFVLLDHMDWLYHRNQNLLQQEWQAIVDRATPDARIIWRSAALDVDFVDPLPVTIRGSQQPLGTVLHYDHELAARLHRLDRVHTYGSFYIAQLHKPAAPARPIPSAKDMTDDEFDRHDQDPAAVELVADSR